MMAYGVQLLHQGALSALANLGRTLLVWPQPEDIEKLPEENLRDSGDYTGSQFDLARKLGII